MPSKFRGNEYRTTMVCVDSYESQILTGRFYNPSLSSGEAFSSLADFLLRMEQALDGMQLPQSFTSVRAFAPPPILSATPSYEHQEGRLATFAVQIVFRRNASWQGSVTWMEAGRIECFRSVLELVMLLNSALGDTSEDGSPGFATA